MKFYLKLLSLAFIFLQCAPSPVTIKEETNLQTVLNSFSDDLVTGKVIKEVFPSSKITDIKISGKEVILNYNKDLSYTPFRRENVDSLYTELRRRIPGDYSFSIRTLDRDIEELVPNYYRPKADYDNSRQPVLLKSGSPVVNRFSEKYTQGLFDKNIVLWQSHGWYYSNKEKRWEWQRPRLFQSVEDLIPTSFTVPYLIPMLENAGANVFVPRERDIQKNEVIVDNSDESYTEYVSSSENEPDYGGIGYAHPPLPLSTGTNPFSLGNTRRIASDIKTSFSAEWIPNIPETGFYSVYISYTSSQDNVKDAKYKVNYYGGTKEFTVNQTIGGGTWIYLGNFKFLQGTNPETGKVSLVNQSKDIGKFISADAVRFGGGMGIVERDSTTSGRPKFFEGARYWLQFAGMPDTLIFNLNKNQNDYNDDYQSK